MMLIQLQQHRCTNAFRKVSRSRPRSTRTEGNSHCLIRCSASFGGAAAPSNGDQASCAEPPTPGGQPSSSGAAVSPPTLWQRLQSLFSPGNFDRKRLAELGFSAFAAYGVVSNLNALVLVTIAWLTVVKQTGKIPLAEGNWPLFLGVYAGLWVTSHFLRPIRLSLALAAAPFVDRLLVWLQGKLRCRKPVAFGIVLVGIAAGSFALLGVLLLLFGGFP